MKTTLMTCLSLVIAACGDGGEGSRGFRPRDLTPPTGQSQAPERSSDSVAPLNSQAPATNSQLPPANTQSAGPASAMCTEVVAALRNAGCAISEEDASDCADFMAVTQVCSQQVHDWLSCLLVQPSCDADGDLLETVCPNQRQAVESCLKRVILKPTGSGTSCRPSSGCQGCRSACDLCECSMDASPNADLSCDSVC